MKSLTRTIIVLVIFNLVIGNFALAQNASNEPEPISVAMPVEPTPPTLSSPGGFTISGNTGLSGVMMFGLPDNIVTDRNGYYASKIPTGWRGRVKPVKEGYIFKPSSKTYAKVTHDQTNQNYVAEMISFIISGRTCVNFFSGRTGVSGVIMDGLPGNPITSRDGTYRATVEYGWTGMVSPKKDGFTFEPVEMRYNRVIKDLTNQNYILRKVVPTPIFARAGSRKVLVIPATDIEAENLDMITQDLHVMSHIFDERFTEPREIKGVFVDFGDFFGRDSRSTEAIYIQGYGVLFLMEVNFAFSHPSEPQEQEAQETEEYIDPDWQRAKQKLFSPQGFGGGTFVPEEKYSAERFNQIKTELTRTLKHAANIRVLKPDEMIILTVIGKARQIPELPDYMRGGVGIGRSSYGSSGRSGGGMGGGMGGMAGMERMGGMAGRSMGAQAFGGGMMMGGGMGDMYGGMEYRETGPASTTVLTIRAKKTDVDNFAIGELDFEQFQQRVEIFTY